MNKKKKIETNLHANLVRCTKEVKQKRKRLSRLYIISASFSCFFIQWLRVLFGATRQTCVRNSIEI